MCRHQVMIPCMLHCTERSICIHTYSCTCPDYTILGSMCKHIHLTEQFRKLQTEQLQINVLTKEDASTEIHELFLEVKSNVGDLDIDVIEIQRKAVDKLRIITTLVEQCKEKLDTTIGLIKCHTTQKKEVFPPINQLEPANKRMKQQRPFFSTRKRRKTCSIRIAKPTGNDKLIIERKLNLHTNVYTTRTTPHSILFIINLLHIILM